MSQDLNPRTCSSLASFMH